MHQIKIIIFEVPIMDLVDLVDVVDQFLKLAHVKTLDSFQSCFYSVSFMIELTLIFFGLNHCFFHHLCGFLCHFELANSLLKAH